jgi:nicotinate phosphoribosyltransferase
MGNSSVYQAIRLGQPATGTMAHSIFMAYNAIYGYRFGNRMCVKDWLEVFNGNSGTLLGDTIGIDMFLESVDPLDLKASSSYRHDSGPWETATTKYIKKLTESGIDPRQKYIVYSNSINMYDLNDIVNNVRGRVQDGVGGIGGAITNNVPSLPKANPQIVMKLDAIQLKPGGPWINCIKNPDEPGKAMGDPVEIAYCDHVKETMIR